MRASEMPSGVVANFSRDSRVALTISTMGGPAMAVKSQLTGSEARDSARAAFALWCADVAGILNHGAEVFRHRRNSWPCQWRQAYARACAQGGHGRRSEVR